MELTIELIIVIIGAIIMAETTFLSIMKIRQRNPKVARGSLLLDTSAIMDGRIVDVAKSGVITAEIIVPRSVIREMQLLADKADHDKRMRARAGLENVRELQKIETVGVTIVNDGLVDAGGVDERLLNLAKNYDAAIATTDYNLNKVAKVVGITVVNVNELAQMLRTQHLPGETVEIQVIQPGANREQAVGYLDDGTMVVVEDAKNLIGQRLKVEIVRSLQTEAGRMMFAKKVAASHKKPMSAFHSDQLKKEPAKRPRLGKNFNKNPNKNSNKNQTDNRNQNQSQNQNRNYSKPASTEDSMVALANKK